MSEAPKQAVPVPAATVMLIRDGADGIEVFMMLRPAEMSFAAGALVFPGGKVDPQDRHAALLAHLPSAETLDETARALRVASIREVFEESGVLLARHQTTGEMVTGGEADELAMRYRADILAGNTTLEAFLAAEKLEFATNLLVPFAHWTTPKVRPKRFDTAFFLAPLPDGQDGFHDGSESLDSMWIDPAVAVTDAEAGRRPMMFPTRANLQRLSESRTVAEALAKARTVPVVPIQPEASRTADGEVVSIPEGLGYSFTRMVNQKQWATPMPGTKPA